MEEIKKTLGVMPIVRRVEVDYLGFARHEDELELEVGAKESRGASSLLGFELRRGADGAVIMQAEQTMVFLNESGRPTRVPDILREKLGPWVVLDNAE